MSTEFLYLKDTYLFECAATVTGQGQDEFGDWLAFDRTVFYPGGGGQMPDRGLVLLEDGSEIEIARARLADFEQKHYAFDAPSAITGQTVTLKIQGKARLANAKAHTGGHLVASAVYESLRLPNVPVKGFHNVPGSYVEFEGERPEGEDLPARVQSEIDRLIAAEAKVFAELAEPGSPAFEKAFLPPGYVPPPGKPTRLVTIEGFLAYPCGGTHVKSLAELVGLQVTKIKRKGGNLRISYAIGEAQ